MNPIDKPRFSATMATLAETYGKKLSPQTVEIYYQALMVLAIEQVDEAAKVCLRYHEHWPKPATLLRLCHEQRAAQRVTARHEPPALTYGLQLVDSMFMTYMHERRVIEGFRGDLNLEERRARCHQLADWIDAMRAEDLLPTLGECMAAFAKSMASVQDVILDTEARQDEAEVF